MRGSVRLGMTVGGLLLVLGLLVVGAGAETRVYKYVDKEGNQHYTDDLNKVPAQYRDQIDDVSQSVRERADEQVILKGSEAEEAFLDGLDRAFSQAGAKPLTLAERNKAIRLSRDWALPAVIAGAFYFVAGLILFIYAIWNKDWWWVVGGVLWNLSLGGFSSFLGAQLLRQPALYATLSVLGAAVPVAYAYLKVAEDRETYIRVILPGLLLGANGILFMAIMDFVAWFGPLVESRPGAFPGLS